MDARVNDPRNFGLPADDADRPHAPAVQPLFATIWPFICIVVVVVAIALADFPARSGGSFARVLLLVVRLVASVSVVALAGVTLRGPVRPARNLQDALAASEERFVGSLSDIQKRRQAEALLFEEKERAQVTLASIADAVVTVDTAGRIEFMNPSPSGSPAGRWPKRSAPRRRSVRRRRRSHRRADRRSGGAAR